MTEIFAQGDLLLERVADVAPSGTIEENLEGVAMVLAEGEATGHRHAIWEHVTMFRDDAAGTRHSRRALYRPPPGRLGLRARDP